MSETNPHRIDPPSAAVPSRVGKYVPVPKPRTGSVSGDNQLDRRCVHVANDELVSGPVWSAESPRLHDSAAQEDWLRLHAVDLIGRLQAWACDLDAREAQLNSRTSLLEHLERRFRLHQQDRNAELAEQQRSIERLRRDLETQTRQLAFQNEAG